MKVLFPPRTPTSNLWFVQPMDESAEAGALPGIYQPNLVKRRTLETWHYKSPFISHLIVEVYNTGTESICLNPTEPVALAFRTADVKKKGENKGGRNGGSETRQSMYTRWKKLGKDRSAPPIFGRS